jgi:hypothetical protein
LVDEDVEGGSRTRAIEIHSLRVHLGDIPCLASRNHEIVSDEVVKGIVCRLEIL